MQPGISSIDRRKMIRYLALSCGLIIPVNSFDAIADILNSTDLNPCKNSLLNADQLLILRDLSETIIPTTDTPGAIAAGVHDFINVYAPVCLDHLEQKQLLTSLDSLTQHSLQHFNKIFVYLSPTEKLDLLTQMEKGHLPFSNTDRTHIKLIKSLVTFAYYTSQIGATQELAYLPIPGGYKGNVKFNEVGRAWALTQ